MIQLLEDRLAHDHKEYGNHTVFLKAGLYDKIRTIYGLGWLVDIGYFKKTLQTSVIRFDKGVDDEARLKW